MSKTSNVPTSFEEFLKQNDIWIPKTRLGKRIFNWHWRKALSIYEELVSIYDSKKCIYKEYRKDLEEDWKKSFPEFSELVSFPETISFKSPKQAIEAISALKNDFEAKDIYDLKKELNDSSRKEWIDEIIAAAPSLCKLIVIRGNRCDHDVLERFNKGVEAYEQGQIISWGVFVTSVAFKPSINYESCIRNWMMVKSQCTVEYKE